MLVEVYVRFSLKSNFVSSKLRTQIKIIAGRNAACRMLTEIKH